MSGKNSLLVAGYSSDKRLVSSNTMILDADQIRKVALVNGTKYSSNVIERTSNQYLTKDIYLLPEGCFSVALSRQPGGPSGFNGLLIETHSLTQEGSDKIADELGLPRIKRQRNAIGLDSKLDGREK